MSTLLYMYMINLIQFIDCFSNSAVISVSDSISNVWPSEGFEIEYNLTDFTKLTDNIYYIWLKCNDTYNNIESLITFDTSIDHCNCNGICNEENVINCYKCKHYFQLQQYLTLQDNDIDKLRFYISPYNSSNAINLSIDQTYISIQLKRCHLYLNSRYMPSDRSIQISWFLSSSCHSKFSNSHSNVSFSVNISSETIDFKGKMIITIINEYTEICQVCEWSNWSYIFNTNCIPLIFETDSINGMNNYYYLPFNTVQNESVLKIMFSSNMIDLFIDTSILKINIDNGWSSDDYAILSMLIVFCLTCTVCCCCCCICLFLFKRNRKLRKENEKQKQFEHKICNPMVISIGIEWYNDKIENPEVNGIYCSNLDGIDRDYENIKRLCKLYKYDIYPKYEKFDWTQEEVIAFIKDCAQKVSENLHNDIMNKYDCILMILSGHGYHNNIITSDYNLINKTAIHRLFSTNYPKIRKLPRIFVFDCCDGNAERSYYPSDFTNNDSDDDDDDKGKNFNHDDIELTRQSSIWKKDQMNPDYKLSLIHAANEGFQAKMNSIDGSYLIYEFVKRMIKNIEDKQNLFFGEIIDGIQQYLHDEGKQQITSIFNNNTRYLNFVINNNNKEMTRVNKLETDIEIEDINYIGNRTGLLYSAVANIDHEIDA